MAGTQAQITRHTRKLNGMKELNWGGEGKAKKKKRKLSTESSDIRARL